MADEAAAGKTQAPANAIPAAPPKAEASEAPVDHNDPAAFKAVGIMAVHQLHLDVGFSEQEQAWIAEGMKNAMSGEDLPDTFKEDLGRARLIYRDQMDKAMMARKAEADTNAARARDFIDALPEKDELTCTKSGLYYKILEPGDPDKIPEKTGRVVVKYSGSLIDGTVFDKNDEGAEFVVQGVVPGFAEGLQLIGEGGKIRLYVPGNLGYGLRPPSGSPIKPGDMLIFDVELDKVIAPGSNARSPQMMHPPMGPNGAGMKTPPPAPTTRPPSTPPPLPPELLNRKIPPPPSEALRAAAAAKSAPAEPAKADSDKTEDAASGK